MMARVVVLISGNGSNLQAIIDAAQNGSLPIKIVLVASNRPTAYGLTRAKNAGIPTYTLTLKPYGKDPEARRTFEADFLRGMLAAIDNQEPDLIVLAGWMHVLGSEFLDRFPGKILNLHPALPGAFDGINAIPRAYEAFKRGEIKETGVMVHHVIPQVDRGQVILQQSISFHQDESLEEFEKRVHQLEHVVIVKGIKLVLNL